MRDSREKETLLVCADALEEVGLSPIADLLRHCAQTEGHELPREVKLND